MPLPIKMMLRALMGWAVLHPGQCQARRGFQPPLPVSAIVMTIVMARISWRVLPSGYCKLVMLMVAIRATTLGPLLNTGLLEVVAGRQVVAGDATGWVN